MKAAKRSDAPCAVGPRVDALTMKLATQKVSLIHIAVGIRSDAWTSALVMYVGSFVYLAVRPSVGAYTMKLEIQKVSIIHIAVGIRSGSWTSALVMYEGSFVYLAASKL